MAYPKKVDHVVGVGASVKEKTRARLYAAATREGKSVSAYIGGILDRVAEGLLDAEWMGSSLVEEKQRKRKEGVKGLECGG